jgi:hypothetical protein
MLQHEPHCLPVRRKQCYRINWRFLVTDSNTGYYSASWLKSFWMAAPIPPSKCFSWLIPRLAAISHQPPSLLFTAWLWNWNLTLFLAYNSSARAAEITPFTLVSVTAGTCLPSLSLAAAIYSCLLWICCLVTDVVRLSVSRPLPRNECCFRVVR